MRSAPRRSRSPTPRARRSRCRCRPGSLEACPPIGPDAPESRRECLHRPDDDPASRSGPADRTGRTRGRHGAAAGQGAAQPGVRVPKLRCARCHCGHCGQQPEPATDIPSSRLAGVWSQTSPAYIRTDVSYEGTDGFEPRWIDVMAELSVTVVLEIDPGEVESISLGDLGRSPPWTSSAASSGSSI